MATRRMRSILIDSTLGKIFTNTASVQDADASKLIAGTKLNSTTVATIKGVVAKLTKNLSARPSGVKFVAGALITKLTLSLTTPAAGQAIVFEFKVGLTYETSTLLGTDSINPGSVVKVSTVSWVIPVNYGVYIDIVQVGSTKPGSGVSVQFSYYTG